jgi:hypothetical protein
MKRRICLGLKLIKLLGEPPQTRHLVVYNDSNVYTSSTTLRRLIDDASQSQVDLGNWKQMTYTATQSELDYDSYPHDNLILVRWYQSSTTGVPTILVLRKKQYWLSNDLEFYETVYNSTTGVYNATKADKYSDATDFDIKTVQVTIPDNLFVLDSSRILIQEGVNFMTYTPSANPELGSDDQLRIETEIPPVIVRKNSDDLYYILFEKDGDTYHQYNYTGGNINGEQNESYSGETISKIIVKFGALFIFTDQYLRVNDFDFNTLNIISINNSKEYQVLRDDDGIYIMPDGLVCIVAGNCDTNDRIYIRTGCTTTGCDAIDKLNNMPIEIIYSREI